DRATADWQTGLLVLAIVDLPLPHSHIVDRGASHSLPFLAANLQSAHCRHHLPDLPTLELTQLAVRPPLRRRGRFPPTGVGYRPYPLTAVIVIQDAQGVRE